MAESAHLCPPFRRGQACLAPFGRHRCGSRATHASPLRRFCVAAASRGGFETRPYDPLACGRLGARLCCGNALVAPGELGAKPDSPRPVSGKKYQEHRHIVRSEPQSPVRYVSTRGEAPSLGFVDAVLAGLARDGGLYVPEQWPHLPADTIAGFAGQPYAEVAVEVMRPFVGEGIAEHDLARLAREAYGNFRHPAVAPLTQ